VELESVQSGSNNADLQKNIKSKVPEGDAKEAFLSVLQGLVGFLAPTPNIQTNIPQVKIAKLEVREKEVQKEEQNYYSEDVDSRQSLNEEGDIQTSENNNLDLSADVNKNATDEAVKLSGAKSNNETKEEVVAEVVVQAKTDQSVEENQTQVIVQQIVNKEVVQDTTSEEKNKLNAEQNAISTEFVAENNIEIAKNAENTALEVTKVQKKVVSETPVEEQVLESYEAQTDVSLQGNEANLDPKSTVKVLNAKVQKDDSGRSLEDEIEVSYFNARELMKASQDNFAPSVDKPLVGPVLNAKDSLGIKVLGEMALQAAFRGQSNLDFGANSNFSKGSNIKLDQNQGMIQSSKPVLEKNSSEKVINNSFHARTAQAQVMIDKVKAVIEQAAVNKTNDSITVKIDPPHLGELTVKVSEKKGQIYAKITPESKEVEEVLRSQARELSLVIQALGYKEEDVEVSIGTATPDFYRAFSHHDSANSGFSNSNTGLNKSRFGVLGNSEQTGINIDNNLTSEDLVGWVA
jgi:flagellar hook-length control protein FliK